MELIKKIKEKLRNKDARTLIENFISLSAIQLIGMILPLITLPYVLRVLGFEKYGVIVFSASLIAYFQSLTDFSFRITAVRDVAMFRNSSSKLNLIYSKVIWIKGIFLLLSLLIIAGIVLCVPSFYEYKFIYALSSLMLIGYALFPEWFFQGIEKMRYITYLNLGIKAFFTICIFVFIRSEEDYWIYPLLQGAGFIGAGAVGQYLLMRKYKLKLIWLPKKIIIDTVKNNFPLFINQFVPTLYNNTTVFMLGFFVEKSVLGVFNALKTIISIEYSLLNSLSTAFFPYNVREKGNFHKFLKIALLMLVCVIFGTVLLKPLIYWYINIQDTQFDYVLYILLIGLFGISCSTIFAVNWLIIHRKDKIVMQNTAIASIIGFGLAYPLISQYGIIGGSIVVCISQCVMGGLNFYYYKKLNH